MLSGNHSPFKINSIDNFHCLQAALQTIELNENKVRSEQNVLKFSCDIQFLIKKLFTRAVLFLEFNIYSVDYSFESCAPRDVVYDNC